MALDMIRSVKESEAEAEQIVKDAQAKARQILKDATDRAYRTVSEQEDGLRQGLWQAAEKGAADAEAECREVASLAEREVSALIQLSSAKKANAVKLIINRMGE